MPVNPLIALSGQSLNTAPAVQQLGQAIQYRQQADRQQEQDKQNAELRGKQSEVLDEQLLSAREDRVLRNIAPKALALSGLLKNGNTEGAKAFLMKNRQELGEQIAAGENVDTLETDEALQRIESGDVDGLIADLDSIVQGAQFKKLIPEAQAEVKVLDSAQAKELYGVDLRPGTVAEATVKEGKLMGFKVVQASDVKSAERQSQDEATRAAGKTSISIDNKVSEKGAVKEAEKLSELRVEKLGKYQEEALAAEEQNFALDQLDNIDVKQGLGTEALAQTARVINALGGDGAAFTGVDPANVQAYNAVTGKQVLQIMSTQKGPQTDADQARIAKTLPSINNEELANEFNKNSLRALNYRKMELSEFYTNYLEEKGTLKGADQAWSKFKRETPLLSDGSVKNPETGLPMFYHEFEKMTMERNPNATKQQVLNAWRELN